MTESPSRLFTVAAAGLALPLAPAVSPAAPDDPAQIAFFEKQIRPLLAEHCYECHSAAGGKAKGGLVLDSEAGWMDGGDSGPALSPGDPAASLIIEAVGHGDPDLAMPPKYKLAEREIEALRRWVAMGAPDPRDGSAPALPGSSIDIAEGRHFWSFKPLAEAAPPEVEDKAWPRGAIDRFVRAAQEGAGIDPAPDADRRALIRRASFDLTGLPPSEAEVDAFLADGAPDDEAFAKVVDRLLASPHFGERWGRHWLDIVRYGESMGRTRNYPFPFAWRYRDYVIAAFNADKPYDDFVREQVAGDLLGGGTAEQRDERLVATGFLALGSMDLNERDRAQFQMDVVDDQIDVTSRAFLGVTTGCARCHDHKFDPVRTEDYYALAGIFTSTDTLTGYTNRQGGNNAKVRGDLLLTLQSEQAEGKVAPGPPPPNGAERNARRQLDEARKRLATLEEAVRSEPARRREIAPLRKRVGQLTAQVKRLETERKAGADAATNMAMGVRDAKSIGDCKICVRGEPSNRGAEVPRGFPAVLMPEGSSAELPAGASGRAELADWIVSQPLAARVAANRVWHHLFGRGLVATVDNFGATGERPTHPALLEHLAARLSQHHGWSLKALIREVMLSRTYALAATGPGLDKARADDPGNLLLWRANVRRLQAEALRDAMMLAAGTLELAPPEGSPVQKLNGQVATGRGQDQMEQFKHRSVYLPILRNNLPEFLETFDFAEPASVIGRRDVTTVSTQALYLLNDRFVVAQAKAAAGRIIDDISEADARLDAACRLVLNRPPSADELAAAREYLADEDAPGAGETERLAGFLQALFASAEFRYVF